MHQGRRALIAVVTAIALVIGLSWAGGRARDWLVGRGHYTVALADVACPVPPGLSRDAFLAEVQYLGTLPEQLSTLDPTVTMRLAAAFALHPWVERVEGVALRGPGGPQVRLRLRTPALAAAGRVLDANGVLLPAGASAAGLPELRGAVPPAGPAGAPWGDAAVEGVARTAAWLQPLPAALRPTTAEATADGLVFTTAGGVTVIWGRPAGADPQGEPAPEAKRERLRDLADKPDGPRAIDLRRP